MLSTVLAAFFSVNWGAVLSFLSVLFLVASATQVVITNITHGSPTVRNQWMQQAVKVAVKSVNDPQNMQAVLDTANAYLKLHHVPVTLDEASLHLVLTEIELVLSGKTTLPQ